MKERLHGLALCAGVGGLELGLKIALGDQYQCVCAVEREAFAAATLAYHGQKASLDDAPIWDDIATFDGKPWRGRVDLVSGGYPCQPFSVAGKRKGEKDPRHLWPHIKRILGEIRPSLCFFENVRGHVRLGLTDVLRDLKNLNYRARAGIYSAAEVGAPHRRERLFILAYCEGRGFRELRKSSGREGQSHGNDKGMVDARGARLQGIKPAGPTEGATGSRSRALDDAEYTQPQGESGTAAWDALPTWPPGPSEREEWERILARWPELAPAVEKSMRTGSSPALNEESEQEYGSDNSKPSSSRGTGGQETPQPPLRGVADGLALELDEVTSKLRKLEITIQRCDHFDDDERWHTEPDNGFCSSVAGLRETLAHAEEAAKEERTGSQRVDRLRACGNGVVPLQAAYAFISLTRKIGILDELR